MTSTAPSPAPPGKPGLQVSPLAVPFPAIAPIAGVELAAGRAGFYKHERDDVLLMRFAEGTTCAGVFTRHGVGSAPVDWCKRQLEATGGATSARWWSTPAAPTPSPAGRAPTPPAGASAAAKRFDCRQREVMLASTGVIGVLLDDAKITARLPEIAEQLDADGWADAARAIMTTDTFAKGAVAEAEIDGVKVRIAGIAKGSGMIAPDMATMLAFVATDAAIAPAALQALARSTVVAPSTRDGGRRPLHQRHLPAVRHRPVRRAADQPAGDARLADFRDKLEGVLLDLAQQLVRDGEGATKFVKITRHRRRDTPPRRARSPAPSPRARWSRPPSPARTPTGAASSWPSAAPTSRSTASGSACGSASSGPPATAPSRPTTTRRR